MKKRILAILLAIALLSSVVAVVAYAADVKCSYCSNTFPDQTTLDDHLAKNKATKKCKDCNWEYEYHTCSQAAITAAETAYNEHYKAMHTESTKYYCTFDNCPYNKSSENWNGSSFDSTAALESHIASFHTEDANALHCPYKDCHYIAYSISDYNNHIAANHQKDGEQVTPRDNAQRFFDKYFMGIGLNVNENSFSSVVRIFAYVTEVFMSVFTDSGASEVFQFAGDSGVTYFFETIVPHFWALFTE